MAYVKESLSSGIAATTIVPISDFVVHFSFVYFAYKEEEAESDNLSVKDIISIIHGLFDMALNKNPPMDLETANAMCAIFGETIFEPEVVGQYLPQLVRMLNDKSPYRVHFDTSAISNKQSKFAIDTINDCVLDNRFINENIREFW